MRKGKLILVICIFSFLFLSLISNFVFITYTNEILIAYPSEYNLIGSTTYQSGSLLDLQSNDSIYMTFQSYGSAISTLYPVTNMNFTGSSEGWSTTVSNTSGMASYGYDDSDGNLPSGSGAGSYFHRANLTTTSANISFITETSFNYSFGTPTSVFLSYAYRLEGDSFGNGSSLTVELVKPDNTTVDLDMVNLPAQSVAWTYKTSIAVNNTYFLQKGIYKLQIISHLLSNNTGTYIQLNFDDVGIKITYYSEYTVEVEFIGSSNTYNWTQIIWTIDCGWNTENISVTLQLFNYTLGNYPTSGNGYISYISSSVLDTDETKSQIIIENPEDFRDSSGNWTIKIIGVKSTTFQFELKVDFVEFRVEFVNTPPVALFTESAETVYTGETITFNASDSYDPDPEGYIVSYFWDFGDGTNATGVIVDHAYADNGNYTVTLTVTDDLGATDTETATKTVLNRLPTASFTESANTVLTGETIVFNASQSYDPDGTIVNYLWDFGDGTNTTGEVVNHSYDDDGNYTITLTVTDDDGATNSTSSLITVLNRPPFADFVYSPESPIVGETVTFNASSSYDVDGSIANYTWDFGDGNVTTTTNPIITHAYSSYGNYTVTLTVTDNDKDTASTTKSIIVKNPPIANFTYTPTSPAVNQTVTFNASDSYDPDGYIVSYVWNFGDDNITTTTDFIIYHKYLTTGNYTVTLIVTDNDGLTDTSSQYIIVRNPPIANFTFTPVYPYVGDNVTFNASSSTSDNAMIVSYVWDFGDGSPKVNETDPITTHVYQKAGDFMVTLTITDSDGLTGSITKSINILKAPVAIFTYSPTSPETYDIITFNASESYDPNGYIISYVWDFGDGNITTVTTPTITHYYTLSGSYTVILIISDNDGYTDSTTKTITILPRPPFADFVYSPESPIVGETVTFNASSSYDVDGSIANYTWDFGDGNVTTTTNPIITHAYSSYGNYTVTLTVTDNDNLTDTKTTSINVRDYPTADFVVSADIIAVNSTTTFNATTSTPNGGVIVSYVWDFGDGSSLNTTDPITTHIYTTIGNYTVKLTVVDSEGLNNTASKIIQVVEKPTARFTYSPSDPYVGDSVTFNASESYDTDGYIISYVWDFGDGSSLNTTDSTVIHIYNIGENYTVRLTVIDNNGLNDTTSMLITINKAPVAIFTYLPDSPIAGDIITFNASESYDVRRSIANYTWDFGDGNVTTTTNPIITHAYSSYGNYTVTLTVTDTGGYKDTCMQPITVMDYPIADFTNSPNYPIKDEVTTFDASASQPRGGIIITYIWDFGDGTKLNTTSDTITHTFTTVGQYNVTLTVLDSEGLTGTILKTIKVRDYPIANFTWSPTYPEATQTVTFNASSSKANSGTIVSFIWDFGDGSPTIVTSIPIVDHAYSSAQDYTVTLTVTNSEGLSSSIAKNITVLKASPIASFEFIPHNQIVNRSVVFNASLSYDPDGYIVNFTWFFGDGNVTTTIDPVITHIYKTAGNYTVRLNVTDNEGLTGHITKTLKIITYPTAVFTWSPLNPQSSKPITFNASFSEANSGKIISYTWDFGDNNVTTTTNPIIVHIYNLFGNYSVTLTVLNSEGLASNQTQILTVAGCPPTANFEWRPVYPLINQTVTFDASNSTPNGGMIVSYYWNFGDGSFPEFFLYTSEATHIYTAYGEYVVTLTVTDNEGQNATISKIIRVTAYPKANFTYSPEHPQEFETVIFNASLSTPNGGYIVNFTWFFGDGNVTTTIDPVITHIYKTAGNYTVRLNVTDNEGLWDTIEGIVQVMKAAYPIADFIYSPISPYVFETVVFNASTSSGGTGNVISYTWDFGDGNVTTVSVSVVTHVYDIEGNYTVTLIIETDIGLNATISKNISINPICGPTADFTWSPTSPGYNQTVAFDASSSSTGWNGTIHPQIILYIWDFGDNSTINTTNLIVYHSFSQPGNYTVTLTVIDEIGGTDTVSKTIEILDFSVKMYDVNGDGYVGIDDIIYVAEHFGEDPSSPNWDPRCDVTGDNYIGIDDVIAVAEHFGEDP
jgi:PKD repeat protein